MFPKINPTSEASLPSGEVWRCQNILAINGSIRSGSNTTAILKSFAKGVTSVSGKYQEINAAEANLQYCKGCLRCNLIKKCSMSGDQWEQISEDILSADVLVFATPIYFHHVSAPLKKIIDRFRAFVEVRITEDGLIHTPWVKWDKDFVLILSMGSSDAVDAQPVIELFEFMLHIMSPTSKIHVIAATRLGVSNQILKSKEELEELYRKINLPTHLAEQDSAKNSGYLDESFQLGQLLGRV